MKNMIELDFIYLWNPYYIRVYKEIFLQILRFFRNKNEKWRFGKKLGKIKTETGTPFSVEPKILNIYILVHNSTSKLGIGIIDFQK